MRRLNALLVVLFAGVVAANCTVWMDPSQPNLEFLPDMVRSARYNAFETNRVFADQQTLRVPPEGTIQRGLLPLSYEATPEDALRAGEMLHDVSDSSDSSEAGTRLFSTFCRSCHGPTGMGDGLVAKRGFPPPPPLNAERAQKMKDGQIFHIITYGQGNMPSHKTQISREDRWRIIRYIRSLQHQASQKAETVP